MSEPVFIGIDGGGTATRARILCGNTIMSLDRRSSINPASVGSRKAVANFAGIVREVVSQLSIVGSPSLVAVVGTAGYGGRSDHDYADALASVCHQLVGRGSVMVLNDVDPLVAHEGHGAAALVLGTGSCAVAFGEEGIIRVGGAEYLASDEGGSTYFGQRALTAAIKAHDGRADSTLLVAVIEAQLESHIVDACRRIASDENPKQSLARLAPLVLECAFEGGDAVALEIVTDALNEVRQMISTILNRSPASAERAWICTGGLVQHSMDYRKGVWEMGENEGITFRRVEDASESCLSMALSHSCWANYQRYIDCVTADA